MVFFVVSSLFVSDIGHLLSFIELCVLWSLEIDFFSVCLESVNVSPFFHLRDIWGNSQFQKGPFERYKKVCGARSIYVIP